MIFSLWELMPFSCRSLEMGSLLPVLITVTQTLPSESCDGMIEEIGGDWKEAEKR
jgi:hypothetical protein